MKYKDLKNYVIEQTYKLNLWEAEKDIKSVLEQLYEVRRLFTTGIEDAPSRPIMKDPILTALSDLINRNAEVFKRLNEEIVYENRFGKA